MNRRDAIRLLAGSSFAAATGSSQPARPNIVFILTDDQRWDAMGCAGHPFLKTPHMDRIAREGALFRNAFVTTPLCSPARASFLTGQYVHKHQVRGNRGHEELSHQLITFPLLLQRAGYETAYVGKWHMGSDDTRRPGFDRWVSFKGQGSYEDPELNIEGKRDKVAGYMTDLLTGHAVDFIRQSHAKPFCLYVGHKAIHGPFTPAPRHKDLYSTEPIVRAPNAKDALEDKPALRRQVGDSPAVRPGGGSSDELIRNQLRSLQSVDDGVGEILRALEETRQLDNTLVVFTSDNGYFWGEHGLGDKRWAFEEALRIPLVMRYPKLIKAGSKFDESALNIDIAPTFLDIAGVAVPANMHGRSLVPVLRGKPGKWRSSFLTEYFAEPAFARVPTWESVRGERYKYVRYTALSGMDELYDLKTDPYEMKNIIADPASRKILRQMHAELERLLKETA